MWISVGIVGLLLGYGWAVVEERVVIVGLLLGLMPLWLGYCWGKREDTRNHRRTNPTLAQQQRRFP